MNRFTSRIGWRRTGGSISVEMAVILPVLLMLLAVPLFLGRVFWYYTVAQKAAHDAARFLATASQAEMRTLGAGGGEADAAAVARWIAAQETQVLQPVMKPLWIYVQCGKRTPAGGYINYGNCGDGVPDTVRVSMSMRLRDTVFPFHTYDFFGEDGLPISADVTMRYAGN